MLMKHLKRFDKFNENYYVAPLLDRSIGPMTYDKDDYGVFIKGSNYCYFKGDKNSADNYARDKNKVFKDVKSSDRLTQTSTNLVDPIIYQVGSIGQATS